MKCIEDEITFELPDGWAWERLSNLATFSGGKTPSTSHREYWDGDVLWVTSKDMKSKYITSSQLRLSTLGAEQMQLYQPNTLLLVTRSGILRHTLPVAILKECATINQDLKAIALYMPQLAEYIYLCLKGMETKLLLKYTKSGTTVENVNFDEFQKVLLPIAPIQEINRIITSTNQAGCIVSDIEEEKLVLAEYITKAKSKILNLAIRGQLMPQNPDDEPASVLLDRIRAEKEELIRQGKIKRDKKESVIFKGEDNSYYETIGKNSICIDEKLPFELPEGWEWIRLRNITQFIRNGASIKQYGDASGIPITRIETISTGEIDRNRFGYANIQELNKYENYVMSDYDILMSHINSPKHLGRCALYRKTDNEVIIHGMNLLSIRPVLVEVAEYLCIVFRSNYFKDFVWKNMKQAVNQASITTTSISDFLFPMPPYKELKQIIKNVNLISNFINKILADLS